MTRPVTRLWGSVLHERMSERLVQIHLELESFGDALEHHEVMALTGEVGMLLAINHELKMAILEARR